jgi:hypothetical protein
VLNRLERRYGGTLKVFLRMLLVPYITSAIGSELRDIDANIIAEEVGRCVQLLKEAVPGCSTWDISKIPPV